MCYNAVQFYYKVEQNYTYNKIAQSDYKKAPAIRQKGES